MAKIKHLGNGKVHSAKYNEKRNGEYYNFKCGYNVQLAYSNSYEKIGDKAKVTCKKCLKNIQKEQDEMALLIGQTILKFVNPLVISVEGHIPQGKNKGQLLIGYVGSLTEFAMEKIKENVLPKGIARRTLREKE